MDLKILENFPSPGCFDAFENHQSGLQSRSARRCSGVKVDGHLQTVPLEFHLLLNDIPPDDVRQMLIVLKNNFKPSKESEHFSVKKDWEKAIRGPSKRMDIPTWLTNMHKVAMKGKQLGIPRFVDHSDVNLMMDALEPIRMLDPGWASSYELLFNRQPEDLPEGRKMNIIQSLVTEFGAHFEYRVRSSGKSGSLGMSAQFRGELDIEDNEETTDNKGKATHGRSSRTPF